MKRICVLLFFIGTVAFGQKDSEGYQKAIRRYTDLISHNPTGENAPTLYMQRGLAWFQSGDYKKAIEDLTKSIDGRIDVKYQSQANYYMGLCFDQLGRYAEAGTSYSASMEGMNQDELIEGRITWDQILIKRAESRKKQKHLFAALNDLKTYRSFNRQDLKIQSQIDSIANSDLIYSTLAHNAFRLFKSDNRKLIASYEVFQQGEYARAISIITSEVSRDPVFMAIRGYINMASGNYQQAEMDFKKSVENFPDFNFQGLSNYYLSFCKDKNSDIPAAIKSISIAGRIFTSENSLIPSSHILISRARWNEQAGRMASAYDDYQGYSKVMPDDPAVLAKLKELSLYEDSTDKPLDPIAVSRDGEKYPNESTDQKVNNPTPENIAVASTPNPEKSTTNEVALETKQEPQSEFAKAIQRYTQLIQTNATNSVFYMQRGIAYFQSDQYGNAISDLTLALKGIDPVYTNQVYYYRASAYQNSGNDKSAISDLSNILSSVQNNNTPIVGRVTPLDLVLTRAELFLKSNNSQSAFLDLQNYRKSNLTNASVNSRYDSLVEQDPVIKFMQYDVYNYLTSDVPKSVEHAKDLFHNGELSAAKELLTRELIKSPEPNSPIYLASGYISIIERDFGQAINHLNTFLRGNISFENRALADFYLGFCWLQQENIEEAINSLTKSLKVFNTDRSVIPSTTVLLLRASLFEKQGFKDMAYADYEKYLETKPGDSDVRSKMATLKPEGTVAQPVVASRQDAEDAKPPVEKKSNPLVDLFKNEMRYALVIGNADYPKTIGALANPIHDANDMAEELGKSNFEVTLLLNASYRQIEVASGNFYKTLSAGPKDQTAGLFYYSGHGLQYEGENLIVPVDALAVSPSDIPYVCNKVDKILGKMEAADSRMSIVVLDACRSNPFPLADRSFSPGLAQVRPARGSYVAFATAPGSTASDGVGRNGLYTQELLKSMKVPNRSIEQVFKEVRKNVLNLSEGKQSTWDNSNIIGEFFFKLEN